MTDFLKYNSLELLRQSSGDRDDLSWHTEEQYPASYLSLRSSMKLIFSKFDLLTHCRFKFNEVIQPVFTQAENQSELMNAEPRLTLIFTGCVKAGKSSMINLILNTKVLPTSTIGSGICVEITHRQNDNKQISIGLHEWSGWEIQKYSDISILELPDKIDEIQKHMANEYIGKEKVLKKRLQVQLPHWFLKNISIFKCSSIDGIYSLDEPFDVIKNNNNPILFHVIDSSNGLMEWDRTFLARIRYKNPNLPIFFIINRIDVQTDTMLRDCCMKFESVSGVDRIKYDSESDCTSTDETSSDKTTISESSIIYKQKSLLNKCKSQIMKMGFLIENGFAISYGGFSAKEFIKSLNDSETNNSFTNELFLKFFSQFCNFIIKWLKIQLIQSILELKSRVNAVVDSVFCEITNSNFQDLETTNIIFTSAIRKKERLITELFHNVTVDIEKQLTKSVKDELKKHENQILTNLQPFKTADINKIFHMMKPTIQQSIETILLSSDSNYSINVDIYQTIEDKFIQLDREFKGLCHAKGATIFVSAYIIDLYSLFKTMKSYINYPHVVGIPDEVFNANTRSVQEVVKNTTRKILGTNPRPIDVVQQAINSITVQPLIETCMNSINNILSTIHSFTKIYQETYKLARNNKPINLNNQSNLVLADFVLELLVGSLQMNNDEETFKELSLAASSFDSHFYFHPNNSKYMYQIASVKSFTVLAAFHDSLCFKRLRISGHCILYPRQANLVNNGNQCLLTYNRLDFDLYSLLNTHKQWTAEQIGHIILQLANIVKLLFRYDHAFPIRLLPTNIMLKQSKENQSMTCLYHPYPCQNNDISKVWPTYNLTNTYQLGLILLCLLFNDPFIICSLKGSRESMDSNANTLSSTATINNNPKVQFKTYTRQPSSSSENSTKLMYNIDTPTKEISPSNTDYQEMIWEKFEKQASPHIKSTCAELVDLCDRLLFNDYSFESIFKELESKYSKNENFTHLH